MALIALVGWACASRSEQPPEDPGAIGGGEPTLEEPPRAAPPPDGAPSAPGNSARPPAGANGEDSVEIDSLPAPEGWTVDDVVAYERRVPASDPSAELESVVVYYGTNRSRSADCARAAPAPRGACTFDGFYTGGDAEELEVGDLRVTFPPGHRRGRIERPPGIWRIRLAENPQRHVSLAHLDAYGTGDEAQDRWVSALRASGTDEAFVYVHGYATPFDDAARRAAQIAHDLDFEGLPLMYSWPSQGGMLAYGADEELVDLAVPSFEEFLDLLERAGIQDLHVIAHSMGNRLVAETLYLRDQRGESGRLISQLVLAAPDIDARAFRRQFAAVLPRFARRVTLYVSDRDRALLVSAVVRDDRPRAGQRRGELLGLQDVDTIDASDLANDFLSHSYYADNETILSDLYCLLRGSPAESRQLLLAIATPLGAAWRIKLPEESTADGSDSSRCTPASAAETASTGGPPSPDGGGQGVTPRREDPPSPWRARAAAALLAAVLLAAIAWLALRARG